MPDMNLRHLIAQVAKAKGISQEKLHEALENAMLKAAKKVFGQNKAIEATFDEERGEVKLFHVIRIVTEKGELPHEDVEEEFDVSQRREDRAIEIEKLTKRYTENQLSEEMARSEYSLDVNEDDLLRLPILYQSELLSRQLTAAKTERRRSKGSSKQDRVELDAQIHNLEARLHEEQEQMRLYTERFGDLLLIDNRNQGFGRIAAQAAKIVIQDKVRQAERDKIYEDFVGREEIVVGEVRRFERNGDMVIALPSPDQDTQVEAILPRREQIPHESYRLARSVKAVITSVTKEPSKENRGSGAQITLSQRHENFVKKLFEQQVPEIYHGIVEIRDVARIYGEARGVKVSVYSKDPNVDPAGACIGEGGLRVKAVEEEIGGDKIEIVLYSSDAPIYVCNAIQPAEVSRLLIDHDEMKMDVIVPDEQLSKAIGRRGKNVRLASLLTGWSLDIYAESKMIERENRIKLMIEGQHGVNSEAFNKVWNGKATLRSLEQFADSEPEDLSSVPGVTQQDAEEIIRVAQELIERRDRGERLYENIEEFHDEAWARWPKGNRVLNRELFERCTSAGITSVETLGSLDARHISERLKINAHQVDVILDAVQALLD